MALDGVGAEADQLRAALGELRLEFGEGAEFGGADWAVRRSQQCRDQDVSIQLTCSPLGERRG